MRSTRRGYSLLETIDNLGARSVLWRLRATVSLWRAVRTAAFGVWFAAADSCLSTDNNPLTENKPKLSTQSVLLVNRWTGARRCAVHKPADAGPSSDARQITMGDRLLYHHYPYLPPADVIARVNVSEELLPYRFAVAEVDLSRLGHRHVTSVRTVDQQGGVQYKMIQRDAYDAEEKLSQRLAKRAATEKRPPPLDMVAQCRIRPLASESHVIRNTALGAADLDTAIREEVESRYRTWIVEE